MTHSRHQRVSPSLSPTAKARLPFWLRRLHLVKAELESVRFPKTATESIRLCAALSAMSLRMLHDRVRREHPGADARRLRTRVADLISRWDRAGAAWSRPLRRGGRHRP